jgi:hypothetical protein
MDLINKYLKEIQIQEGPILIGMGVLAASMAVLGVIDYAKGKKAESILSKNKQIVDKIVASNIKTASQKAKQVGTVLSRTLNTKYKDVVDVFPEHIKNSINDLPKANYEKEIKSFINSYLKRTVKYKKVTDPPVLQGFFFHHMNIGIMEGPASEAAEQKHPEFEENEYDNRKYNAWLKRYNQYFNLVLKTDKAFFPVIKTIIKNIIQQLNKLMNNKIKESKNLDEAGFETKPKGWTDKSIKKYSSTFSKKMKGNVKSKGFFDKCVKKMQGKVDNPEGFCAALKDENFKSTGWRGKDKSPEEVEKDTKKKEFKISNIGEDLKENEQVTEINPFAVGNKTLSKYLVAKQSKGEDHDKQKKLQIMNKRKSLCAKKANPESRAKCIQYHNKMIAKIKSS